MATSIVKCNYEDVTSKVTMNGAFTVVSLKVWRENRTVHFSFDGTVSSYVDNYNYTLATLNDAIKADGIFVGNGMMPDSTNPSASRTLTTYVSNNTVIVSMPTGSNGKQVFVDIIWHI